MNDILKFQPIGQAAKSADLKFNFNITANEPYKGLNSQLSYKPFASNDEQFNGFVIEYDLNVGEPMAFMYLKLTWLAWFSVEGNLPEDLVANDFVMVNAPAIAYPFLRTFVHQLTLLAGVQPLMLPVVNFVELAAYIRQQISDAQTTAASD